MKDPIAVHAIDVKRALDSYPGMFTEQNRELLSLYFGLVGPSPTPIGAIAKKFKMTQARTRQKIAKLRVLVAAITDELAAQ